MTPLPLSDRSFDLSSFSFGEMAECAAAIRRCGIGADSMEEAADAILTFLRRRLVDADGNPAAALARVFTTARLDALDERLQGIARAGTPGVTDDTECLTLLATTGALPAWNDRRSSVGHQVIPLVDTEMVHGLPMIAGLLRGLGLDIDSVVAGEALSTKETFGVFHVETAPGSELIPSQEFVDEHGIRSAIGFGGALPSGRVFAIVLFSTVHIDSVTADLFGPIGVSVRLALMPFDTGAVFAGRGEVGPGPRDIRAEATAYAQLLEAFESTATTQAARLEQALSDARSHQDRLEAEARVVETLHFVGSALAGELDLDRIVDVATDAATVVTGAQFGAFFYNTEDEAGESYVLYKIAGVPEDRFTGFPMPRNTAVFEPTFRGTSTVRSDDITADPRYGKNAPYHGLPEGHLPVRSYLAVPVMSRSGEVLGGIFLGHEDRGVFDTRDERLAKGIAGQASTAIDTARLYRTERQARQAAERTAEQLARLQASTAGLAQAASVQEVTRIVVEEGASGLLADGATLFLARDDKLIAVASHGESGGTPTGVSVDMVAGLPLTDAIERGEPVVVGDADEFAAAYPELARQPSARPALAVLPFTTGEGQSGAVVFTWSSPRRFTPEDRQFMLALGSQCVQAIERATLAEAERENARRQSLLSEASRELAGTLDVNQTIQRATRLCLGELAASAAVHLVDADGLGIAWATSVDAGLADHLARLQGDEPARTGDPRLWSVVDSGEVFETPHLETSEGSEHVVRPWGIVAGEPTAAIALPLEARAMRFGVLCLTRPRPYDDAEVATLRDLAGRIAVAIDNARLHAERSETAILLQRSLLPPHLPGIPGMEVDVRYRALAKGSDLGGDFYDVFRINRSQWGAVIGDVCGKGVAAASLTALARFTARAAALGGATVSEVLSVVNRAVLDEGVEDRFCTMVALLVEPDHPDGVHIRMAVGGHPLPMVVSPDGPAHPVGSAGMVVGLFDEAEWGESTFVLRQSESLVLYTDGVTEARTPDGEFDPGLLATILDDLGAASATALVEGIESAVLAFERGEQRDDLAVLALRAVGPGAIQSGASEFDRRFPPIAASVSMARHEVSAWLRLSGDGPSSVSDELLLVVTELATNAMRAARTGFHLRLWTEGDAVVLELADDGPGFDHREVVPAPSEEPELLAERGRGLYLLRQLMDDTTVESNESGTVVRARKRFAARGA